MSVCQAHVAQRLPSDGTPTRAAVEVASDATHIACAAKLNNLSNVSLAVIVAATVMDSLQLRPVLPLLEFKSHSSSFASRY